MHMLYENENQTVRVFLYPDNSLVISIFADTEYIIYIKQIKGKITITKSLINSTN